MKILFIGDIVGYLGREAVKKILPKLKRKYRPDLIIANAENLAHGKGVTETTLKEMREAGIDCFTSGNHIFAKKETDKLLGDENLCLLRPANYPPEAPGIGEKIISIGLPGEAGQKNILLLNLMGRVFIQENFDCPFRKFDEIIKKYKGLDAVIVDLHAEATSEKKAFSFYADGRATAIIGTHTHIQTADEQISLKGTAYLTDAGMVGGKDSVLGVKTEIILKNFLNQINHAHEFPRQGECEFNAVLITIDAKDNKAKKIQRIQETVKIK